jgi:methionyl aminopeptidase
MLIVSCKAGTSLITLDEMADQLIKRLGGTSSFYQYNGFPGHICISVNQQLIHGIPNNYIIQPNDLVTFDVGVTYNNHVCDAAYTVVVEPGTNPAANDIDKVTYECLMEGIKEIKPGNYTGDISHKIYEIAKDHGYEVIKDFGGHGCGNKVHEDPMILNYGEPGSGVKLVKGMVLCIEPMLMTKSDKYVIDETNH